MTETRQSASAGHAFGLDAPLFNRDLDDLDDTFHCELDTMDSDHEMETEQPKAVQWPIGNGKGKGKAVASQHDDVGVGEGRRTANDGTIIDDIQDEVDDIKWRVLPGLTIDGTLQRLREHFPERVSFFFFFLAKVNLDS